MYASPNDEIRAVIAVSKRYERDGGYWYACHDSPQRAYLRDAKIGYFVLGMVDKKFVHAIPLETLDQIWDELGETVRNNGSVYKHIVVANDDGRFSLRLKGVNRSISIDEFRLGK